MAYIAEKDLFTETTVSTSVSVSVPGGHLTGDLLVVIATQRLGANATPIATATSGWAELGTQATVNNVRAAVFWKIASSDSEPEIELTGANFAWAVQSLVIRGFNAADPFDGFDRTGNSSAKVNIGPKITTTANNALLIHAHISGATNLSVVPNSLDSLMFVSNYYQASNAIKLLVGYNLQVTADTSAGIEWVNLSANSTAQTLVFAVRDATPATPTLPVIAKSTYKPLHYFGDLGIYFESSDTWLNLDTTNIAAATMDGVPVTSSVEVTHSLVTVLDHPTGRYSGRLCSANVSNVLQWVGSVKTLASTVDFTDKIVSMYFYTSSVAPTITDARGWFVYLEDSVGGWALYRITQLFRVVGVRSYLRVFDFENEVPYTSSGTFDITDVAKFGVTWIRRGTATSAHTVGVKNLFWMDRDGLILTGGSTDRPVTLTDSSQFLDGWLGQSPDLGLNFYTKVQGGSQVLATQPFTIGNGIDRTIFKSLGTSFTYPLPFNTSAARRWWKVDPLALQPIAINAGSDDIIDFSGTLISTSSTHKFEILSTSNVSADYIFTGATLINFQVAISAAIEVISAQFLGCDTITLAAGAGLSSCLVGESKATSAVVTPSLSVIEGCSFISAGSGHAIQVTTPGTYLFEGNSFSGYGADTTVDAAIYNNSGGLVTILLPTADQTPTIRNGAGASTVIATPLPTQSVTVDNGLSGTRLQIYDLTSSTELYNNIPGAYPFTWTDDSEWVADREIRIRAARVDDMAETAALFVESVIGTSTIAQPALSFRLNQENDAVYELNQIVGSSVTGIAIDDAELLINVDTGSITWSAIYAYETYWLSTETGIRDEGRIITALDASNYIFENFKIKNVSSPSVPLSITGGWGRDKDTGLSATLIDNTGGTIFSNPDLVITVATGSGVTAQDKLDIAAEVRVELTPELDQITPIRKNTNLIPAAL